MVAFIICIYFVTDRHMVWYRNGTEDMCSNTVLILIYSHLKRTYGLTHAMREYFEKHMTERCYFLLVKMFFNIPLFGELSSVVRRVHFE